MLMFGLVAVAYSAAANAAVAPCETSPEQCVELRGSAPGASPMPLVALGTWRGSYKDCADNDFICFRERARTAVGSWLEIGGTHIDGANDYRTQVEIAEALRERKVQRQDVFITTKCPGPIGMNAMVQCAEDNLQMLGQYGVNSSGYIDLLLIHFPWVIKPQCMGINPPSECAAEGSGLNNGDGSFYDPGAKARQESWRALELLQYQGRVKAIGISDYNATHIAETLATATKPIALHQVEWNPLHHDESMLALCRRHGIQLQAWSPLGGTRGAPLSDARVKRIAATHNVSAAQVVLKWSLQRGVAVVTGTDNVEHMKSDLDLWGFELTDGEMATVSALGEMEATRVQLK